MANPVAKSCALLLWFSLSCAGQKPAPQRPLAPASQPAAAATEPDAAFRREPPRPSGKLAVTLPAIERRTLRSGIDVYIAHKTDVPLVSVQIVSRGGAEQLRETVVVGKLLAEVMPAGAGARDALAVSERLQELGAGLSVEVDWGRAAVSLSVPSQQLAQALPLLLDVAFSPNLSAKELERARTRQLAALAQSQKSPAAVFHKAIAKTVFGEAHAYARGYVDEQAKWQAIQLPALKRAHRTLFAEQKLAVVLSGDVPIEATIAQLEAYFGAKRRRQKAASVPSAPQSAQAALHCQLMPGAQSQIAVVAPTVAAKSADREALTVMNAVLGGMFSSRLNLNLRERHGYSYGARSHFDFRASSGLFAATSAVVADKTAAALQEMLNEIANIRESDVSEQELRMAKDALTLSLPAQLETTSAQASTAARLFAEEMPADELQRRMARIEAVSVADVRRVAAQHLRPELLRLVVVAGAGSCEELAALSPSAQQGQ